MKKYILSGILALAGTMSFTVSAEAATEDFIFTYDYEGATHDVFGVQRCVQIDAAMLLQNPALVGFEIIGVSVDIPVKEGCECSPMASAWLSKTLQVDGEFNQPDTKQVNGEIKNYGTESEPELRLDLTFPEPYKLTDEGIYVGYSVNVLNCNVPGSGWTAKYPIVTVCDIDKPQGLMIHCTKDSSTLPQKYPEWTDLGESKHQALAMRVIMRGQTMENAATLEPLQVLYSAPGSTELVYVNLNNLGTAPISSITYSYSIGTETITNDVNLDIPVPGQHGAYTTLDLPFEAPDATGKYSIDVHVDKVNGLDNGYNGTSVLDLEVVPFLPVHRPIVEDYSGFWCGYCPEVYVAVKQMHDKYGDEFLPITYHVNDRIQGVSVDSLPSSSYGMPKVYMENRKENIEIPNMESLWLRQRRELAPADIDVKLFWNEDTRTALRAESSVKFVYDEPDADYMVAYAMIEDGMSDPDWRQANSYTDADIEGPYWDLFCGKGFRVSGLIYDDVVVSFPQTTGIEGSLPSAITAETEYKHSSVLCLDDAKCRYQASTNYGNNIIKDSEKLRIVALLIDGKTGCVRNAATTGYSGSAPVYGNVTGIDSPAGADPRPTTIHYYTLQGRRLSHLPVNGPYIIVTHLSDGTLRTEKRLSLSRK